MKITNGIIYTLLLCIICVAPEKNLHAQWMPQTSGTGQVLNHIYFYDANTGYCFGSINGFLKTTNGGENWSNINNGDLAGNIQKTQFFTSQSGVLFTSFADVFTTTNAGNNWISIYSNGCSGGHAFDMTTMLMFKFGEIRKTTNSGGNWNLVHSDTGEITSMTFINNTTGFAGGHYGNLKKTIDGGNTWSGVSFPDALGSIYNINFINSNTGWAISASDTNKLYKTTDGGNTWISKYSSTNYLYGFDFYGTNIAWLISADGTIPYSIDGGDTWTNVSVGGFSPYSVDFVDGSFGWACGFGGKIYHTTNGGGVTTSLGQYSSELPDEYKLEQNYPNPFNPSTNINFNIARSSSQVKLVVYNSLGQIVEELVNKTLQPGSYSYTFSGDGLPSGVYYYKLSADEYSQTKKMLLVK